MTSTDWASLLPFLVGTFVVVGCLILVVLAILVPYNVYRIARDTAAISSELMGKTDLLRAELRALREEVGISNRIASESRDALTSARQ